jgi:NAD dependent epimerase/dehydratase family enzyme
MRIVLAGGTGQIGAILKRAFAADDVTVLARSATSAGTAGRSARGRARSTAPTR